MCNGAAAIGGVGAAQSILEASMGRDHASQILGRLAEASVSQPFAFLAEADPKLLLTFLADEHPQTIALVLAYMRTDQRGAVAWLSLRIAGKVEGCSHGYGGSMHLYDVARGTMGANAVVGGGLPATVGAALAFQMRREPRVALAFFGDGATNIGAFHESLNLAQLWTVPAVFVCENNRWSESTPQSQHQPITDLTQRALAFGMHALHVDGQDVEAVHLAALEALEHARSGHGPVFLLCETERLTGHYIGDPQVYRDKQELERLRQTRDPVRTFVSGLN